MTNKKILFFISGSIAAYKACQVISDLRKLGHELEIVASPSALEFVGAATLEGLSGRAITSSLFQSGKMMDHIHLVRWADILILCPATANSLNSLANGSGDSLLATFFLAHDFSKPFLVFPAMNTSMYQHPVTKRSMGYLKEMGIEIFDTNEGQLACGETGYGRMLEPPEIVRIISERMS